MQQSDRQGWEKDRVRLHLSRLERLPATCFVADDLVIRKRAELSVEYVGDPPTKLQKQTCLDRLTDEIKACARGGSKQTGDWIFT